MTEKKKEFNKNFEDTETITKINVEQNNKTGDYFPQILLRKVKMNLKQNQNQSNKKKQHFLNLV